MPRRRRALLLPLLLLALPLARAHAQTAGARVVPFRSQAELEQYFAPFAAVQRAEAAAAAAASPTVPCTGASGRVTGTGSLPLAQSSEAVVAGGVRGPDGQAITDAVVTVMGTDIGAHSDAAGHFRLRLPIAALADTGARTLLVRRIGYEALRTSVPARAGRSATVAVTLCLQRMQLQTMITTATGTEESVTNVQHAGVDEGGIVKLHGGYLVMLRRGRLFTVAVGGDTLRPVATVNAYGPDVDPRDTWYDELLVSGDRVVVLGYSYRRGGTELGIFRIDDAGGLRHLSTWTLRSNDYYSARNYASRLVDGKLILYTPLRVRDFTRVGDDLPAIRRWRGEGDSRFTPIATPTQVFRPSSPIDPHSAVALHTVTTCDLATPELECRATVVIGAPDRVFYVSPSDVFVWTSANAWWLPKDATSAVLYRMPLDGAAPAAASVHGSPVDQYSFLQDSSGTLNVVVRAGAGGDAMWRSVFSRGATALLRLPAEAFGSATEAQAARYLPLPNAEGGEFHNRFIGTHLLYGAGSGWRRADSLRATLHALRLGDTTVTSIRLSHGVDRIEAMGDDAIVIGSDGPDLVYSGIALDRPRLRQVYRAAGQAQGELRSHGYFYHAEADGSGVLGLPVAQADRAGDAHLVRGSAAVSFVRNTHRGFLPVGDLAAHDEGAGADGCVASCVDWYGNARPLFVRGRVLALLGYELVEGRIENGWIREVARVTYAPPVVARARN